MEERRMPLTEGQEVFIQGSARDPYRVYMKGGVVVCTCPSWRNCKAPSVDLKHCKHTVKEMGTLPPYGVPAKNGGVVAPASAAASKAPAPVRLAPSGAGAPASPVEESPDDVLAAVFGKAPARPTTVVLDEVDPASPALVALEVGDRSIIAGDSSRGNCMLAHAWDWSSNLKGWFASTKWDGLRALYKRDPAVRGFWSRENGVTKKSNKFFAPDYLLAELPDFDLDGEFVKDGARGQFQETQSIVRSQDFNGRWKSIKYMVFDAPTLPGSFKERVRQLREWFDKNPHPHVILVEQTIIVDNDHIMQMLDAEEGIGGEGLMAKDPDSLYEVGKSPYMWKVKRFFDCEARVVGHTAGKKARAGTTGALECTTIACELQVGKKRVKVPEGVKFKVGSGLSAKEWSNPPPVGAIVTVRFLELTNANVPRNPSYTGVRDKKYW
jgi:DNA ligase-1